MEALILLGLLTAGFIIVGSIIAFTNLSAIGTLKKDIKKLNHHVNYQRTLIENLLSKQVKPNDGADNSASALDNAQSDPLAASAESRETALPAAASSEKLPISPAKAIKTAQKTRSIVPGIKEKPAFNFSLDTF